MKKILITLLVVAVVLLTLGAVNHAANVDVDLVFGTWHHAQPVWLSVIVVCLVVVTGLLAAGYTGVQAGRTRQKLERELDETYRRLRATEARVASLPPAPAASEAATELSEAAAASEATVGEEPPAAESTAGPSPAGGSA